VNERGLCRSWAADTWREAPKDDTTRRGRASATPTPAAGTGSARGTCAVDAATRSPVARAAGADASATAGAGSTAGIASEGAAAGAAADGCETAAGCAWVVTAGCGATAGTAGGGTGAGAGGAGVATGRYVSGSRYPCGSDATRMPRCTYGSPTSGSLLGPIVPITSPSVTVVEAAATIDPRCVSVTQRPSAVVMVTTRPEPGTLPANVTVPVAGARMGSPSPAPMSMPRCSPAAYGCAGSKLNGWRTGPPTGHVQARATGATSSAVTTARRSTRRMDTTSVVRNENGCSRVGATWPRCQSRLQSCHRVPR